MGADLFGSCCHSFAAVLGNYVGKGGSIDDASAELTYFITNGYCRFGILFSIIGTLLVKITDDNAKEAQVQKH
jgi:K(+)-stimulated pyrophosphate-energized sodium pump